MNLCLINHSYRYELEKLLRIYSPFEKIEYFDYVEMSDRTAVARVNGNIAEAELYVGGNNFKSSQIIDNDAEDEKKEYELKLALALYECLKQASGYIPQWGILTGVRPAKLYSRFVKDYGENYADKYFKNTFKVNEKKLSLCKETFALEEDIVSMSSPNSFSLYISIPFCPTRCSYCSFVSHSVESARKLIPSYVETLCKELKITAELAKKYNLKLETVYIGGGTPTAISAEEIDKIMKTVECNFDLKHLKEYTVEAGRPDTITKEKLITIKNNDATRISINPQTMNDSVLEAIGRKHTAEDTKNAFNLARNVGFTNINMDLIAGLPTDTPESFKNTIEEVLILNPESVTVHSLSMKRSSELNVKGLFPETEIGEIASTMVDFAHDKLTEYGILPYYMYRQSKTVGNLENVGYSKKGFECLYNVYIMDETHTILACGASAVTKLREPNGDYIERIFNYKYPYEYIDHFDEIISRKKAITEFYDKFGW